MTRGVMFGFLLLSMVMIIAGVYGFVHLYFRPDAVLFIDADFALMAGTRNYVRVGWLSTTLSLYGSRNCADSNSDFV